MGDTAIRSLWALLIPVLTFANPAILRGQGTVVLPGEWEPQQSIWLGWEERPELQGYHQAVFELIWAVKDEVQIKIVTTSDSATAVAQSLITAQNIDLNNIIFLTVPGNRYWIRDHGPTFVKNQRGELLGVDFDWKVRAGHDSKIDLVDRKIAELEGLEVIAAPVVNEGGAIESNGKGTIILVESVTLDRNPLLTKAAIEEVYRKSVGAKKIIWLNKGLAQDPNGTRPIVDNYYGYGTGGHVDEFARFVDPNTILLAWVSEEEKGIHPINQINYEILRQAYEVLSQETDQDGKPFRIIRIPLPDIISEKRSVADITQFEGTPSASNASDSIEWVAAASYNNFLITNGYVLLPTYTKHGSSVAKENQIKKVFTEVFPHRKLIFIDCIYQNYRGGGIHCSTKQQPFGQSTSSHNQKAQ
ncbi:MAG: agmatine deiminase family protein [Bacteroidota bacterium]